jgi:uncharacterized membrane-anchored protein
LGPAPAEAQEFVGFEQMDISAWEPREAKSLMAIVEPLYRNHPESAEGRPTLRVDVRKGVDGRFRVEVERTGLADDAIESVQHRAIIARNGDLWRLEAMGWRQRCNPGRGWASSWTIRPCA